MERLPVPSAVAQPNLGSYTNRCIGGEQLTLNQRVQGSSPCAPTNEIKCLSYFTGVTATQKSRQGWPMGGTTIEATA
jgi:hypothetical protein